MFTVVEFHEECGGGLSVVRNEWFTPRKQEVFWPPHKDQTKYSKCLRNGETIDDRWKLYKIERCFFETGINFY